MKTAARTRADFGCIIPCGTSSEPAFKIRWFEGRTRRQRSGFKTKRDARIALAEIRVSLENGSAAAARKAERPFRDVGREWLRVHSAPNLRSHGDNLSRWDNHLDPRLGDVALADLTPRRILEFRAELQTDTKKRPDGTLVPKHRARTINQILQLLRAILKYAVLAGYIPACPTDRIGRGKYLVRVDKTKMEPPIATANDAGRLLACVREVREDRHALFATLLYLGLRKGELAGLRWCDVDFRRGFVTVRRSYGGPPKSGREREVPMPAPLVTILEAHKLAAPFKDCELVFPNDSGTMFTRFDQQLQHTLDAALDSAGLPRMTLHKLRHAYASFFVMSGGSIFDLQRNLGHSSVQLTSEVYAHLSPDHRVKDAQRLHFPEPAIAPVVHLHRAPVE